MNDLGALGAEICSSLPKSSPSTLQSKSSRTDKQSKSSSSLSHVPCKFFKQGTCTAGTNCIFSHNLDPTSELSVCKYFRKGKCKFGTKCALLHTMSPYNNSNNSSSSHINKPYSIPTSSSRLATSFSQSYERDYFLDPFVSSAPSPSPFSLPVDDSRRSITNHSYADSATSAIGFQVQQQQQQQSSRPSMFHTSSPSTATAPLRMVTHPSTMHSIAEDSSHHHSYYKENNTFEDVNDFILPSSLNDLLTPTELRKQYIGIGSTSSRQASYEPEAMHVPFYMNGNSVSSRQYSYEDSSPQSQLYLSNVNAINIPGDNNSYYNRNNLRQQQQQQQQEFLPGYNMYPDEEGPFVMDDTNVTFCTDNDGNTNNYRSSSSSSGSKNMSPFDRKLFAYN